MSGRRCRLVHPVRDSVRVDFDRFDPDRVIDEFGPERLNPKTLKHLQQVIDDIVAAKSKTRCETTPERPPRPLKNALTGHIIRPLARAVETVAVAFDGKAAALTALNDKVDTVCAAFNLRLYTEASLY